MGLKYNYAVVYKNVLEAVKSAMYTGEIEHVVAPDKKEAIRQVKDKLGDKVKNCTNFIATRLSRKYGVKNV